MIPQKRRYLVIIVHYGDVGKTLEAVESLRVGSYKPDDVVVVDHGREKLDHNLFLPAVVVRPSSNGGWAAGVNVGLGALYGRGATISDIVVCMNNDVTVRPKTLGELKAWWDSHSYDAVVGGMVYERGVVVVGGGRVNLLTGRAKLFTLKGPENTSVSKERLDYIHGAFFSAPYGVFIGCGGMPEKYFMYWEDVFFGWKARRLGYKLQLAPLVIVDHDTSPTPAYSPDQLYYLVRNGALFMEKDLGAPVRWWWFLVNRVRLLYHMVAGGNRVVREALRDAVVGVSGRRRV